MTFKASSAPFGPAAASARYPLKVAGQLFRQSLCSQLAPRVSGTFHRRVCMKGHWRSAAVRSHELRLSRWEAGAFKFCNLAPPPGAPSPPAAASRGTSADTRRGPCAATSLDSCVSGGLCNAAEGRSPPGPTHCSRVAVRVGQACPCTSRHPSSVRNSRGWAVAGGEAGGETGGDTSLASG